MKHFFTFLFAAFVFSSNATIKIVTCQNTPAHFLPITLNANCGDTVRWVYVAGVHIVGPITATDIPVGAAMWNAPINTSFTSFDYKVTVPGNYHYVCHPATPHGEDAYIVVSCPAGVQQYNATNNFSLIYPNPFSQKIIIESPDANLILISNLLGEKINSFDLKSGEAKLEADLATLPKGIYFFMLFKDKMILETRKIVKE